MDRQFVDESVTPDTIFDAFVGTTEVQGEAATAQYSWQWIKVSGPVMDVSSHFDRFNVGVYVGDNRQISLEFPDTHEEVKALARGEIVEVQGRIDGIASWILMLKECELLSRRPAPPPMLPELPTNRPSLPVAALKAWHRAFLLAYPTGSKELAEKSAIAAFPDHHVARQRVRDLFPDATMGRPKKTKS